MVMRMRLRLHRAGDISLNTVVERRMRNVMERRARTFIRRLQSVTPVRTGFMKANWYYTFRGQRTGGLRMVIGNRADYSAIVVARNHMLGFVWSQGF